MINHNLLHLPSLPPSLVVNHTRCYLTGENKKQMVMFSYSVIAVLSTVLGVGVVVLLWVGLDLILGHRPSWLSGGDRSGLSRVGTPSLTLCLLLRCKNIFSLVSGRLINDCRLGVIVHSRCIFQIRLPQFNFLSVVEDATNPRATFYTKAVSLPVCCGRCH